MNQETPVDALVRAVKIAGSQSALASGLSAARVGEPITAARVWNWVNRDKKAPAEFCPDIESLTGVLCEELAPDVNWAVLRKGKKKSAFISTPDIANLGPDGAATKPQPEPLPIAVQRRQGGRRQVFQGRV